MRKLLVILFLLCFVNSFATRRTIVPAYTGGAYYFATSFTWNPGDTFVIKNSDWPVGYSLALDGFRPPANNKVVIINEGSTHTNLGALLLRNCWNIKVTGTGASDFYGFVSDGAFSAIDIDGRSKSIEVDHFKMINCGYGFRAKQDPACADSLNYPNWHMDSIVLHDYFIQYVNQDAIYGGNTAPTTGRPIFCSPVTISPIPMRLSNFFCYNGFIDSVGRTAIQLSGCDSGFSRIHHLTISRCGYEVNNTQGSGIILGGMTKGCTIDSNTVKYTFQFSVLSLGYSGSQSVGFGANIIQHNNLDSSGMIPLFHTFSNTVTNTDTTYWPIRAGGAGNDITWYLQGTRTSGTTAGTWYILGSPDGVTYTRIANVKTLTNSASQIDTIHLLAGDPSQYYKVVVNQVGTQVNVWKAFIMNPGYPFGIASNCLQTFPEGDSTTTQIKDNIVANPNPKFISSGVVFGAAVPQITKTGNAVCNNVYQNGTDALVTNQTTIDITTACAGGNIPPVVNAGPNQSIVLPTSAVSLVGNAFDIDGTITGVLWTQDSGPSIAIFDTPTSTSTAAAGLIQGTYVFRLTATDNNGATGFGTSQTVVIVAGNTPPTADAGGDKTLRLPTNATTLVGSGSDPDGTIVAYAWTIVSGSFATITAPTSSTTNITDLVAGDYVFRLTVTDNLGAIGIDDVSVTVLAAAGTNTYYRPLVIDHTKVSNTNQSNFPVLISISGTYLKSVANGGKVQSNSGLDITFSSDSVNSSPLSWEIENYDPIAGTLQAWVRMGTLSHLTDSTIYINYGDTAIHAPVNDKTEVWNSGFIAVLHMNNGNDATLNKNNGVVTALLPEDGEVDGAYTSSTTSQYVDLGQQLILSETSLSFSAIVYIPDYTKFWGLLGKTLNNQPNPYDFYIEQTTGKPIFFRGDGIGDNSHVDGTSAIPTGQFVYVSVSVNGAAVVHYINGVSNGGGNLTNPDVSNSAGNTYIGTRSDFVTQCPQIIDESRISSLARSGDWFKTEYNSYFSPGTFITVGSEHQRMENPTIGTIRKGGKLIVTN